MSDHSFNPFIAKNYGINVAVLINSFIFWTRTNSAKGKNNHEDRFWCYGTPEYFAKFFPYFKPRLIRDIFKKCIELDLLIKGNFNKKGYDKTNWYALSDKILIELNLDRSCLSPAPSLIRRKASNGFDVKRPMDTTKNVQPIPATKPDTKKTTTTTTEIPSQDSKNSSEPVVVVVKSFDSQKDRLLTAFRSTPFVTEKILDENDFLSACEHSLKYRDKGISESQRLRGILKLVSQGAFEEPKGWIPNKVNIDVEERMRLQEQESIRRWSEEQKVKPILSGEKKKTSIPKLGSLLDAYKQQ